MLMTLKGYRVFSPIGRNKSIKQTLFIEGNT